MPLPTYDELIGSANLPSYDELVASPEPPLELQAAREQQDIERQAAAGTYQPQPPANPIPFLEKPLVQFPHLPVTKEQSLPARVGSAVLNKAGDFVSGVTGFQGLIGLFPPVGIAQIIAQTPDLIEKVKKADETPPGSPERIDAGLDVVAAVGSLGAMGAAMKAGLKTGARVGEVVPQTREAPPQVEVPQETVRPASADQSWQTPQTRPPGQTDTSAAAVANQVSPEASRPEITTPQVEPSIVEPDVIQFPQNEVTLAGAVRKDAYTLQEAIQNSDEKAISAIRDKYAEFLGREGLSRVDAGKARLADIADRALKAGREAPSVPDATDAGAAPVPPKAKFTPSTEWQEIPEGIVLPNGGEYRFDQRTGKNYARWKSENLPETKEAAPESNPAGQGALNREGRLSDSGLPQSESMPEQYPPSREEIDAARQSLAQEGIGSPTRPALEAEVARLREQQFQAQRPSSENTPTGPKNASTERVGDDPFISRIANRFTEERAKQGELGEIAPGQGYATTDLVQRGLRMAPEEINQHVSDVMNGGGNDPVAQAAAIRAEEARLSERSAQLSRVAEANPTNLAARQAANSAFQDVTDFHNGPIAKLKERFHATGMALQGEIPVDLSTINGLREKWLKDNGKAPPPTMEPTFRRTAANVRRVTAEENATVGRLGQEIEKATRGRKMRSVEEVRNAIVERMKNLPCRV
jgi:hypothetical protein